MLAPSTTDKCVRSTIKNALGIDPDGRITKNQAQEYLAKSDEHVVTANFYKVLAGRYLARARDRATKAGKTVEQWVTTKPLGLGRTSVFDHIQVEAALFGADAKLDADVLRLPWREIVRRARHCRADDGDGGTTKERTPAQQEAAVIKSADAVLRKADALAEPGRTSVLEEIAEKIRSLLDGLSEPPANDDGGDDDPLPSSPVTLDPDDSEAADGGGSVVGDPANDDVVVLKSGSDAVEIPTPNVVGDGTRSLVMTWADIQREFPACLAPFPYTGGKRRVANLVWQGLGDVVSYIEPFFGSGSVLLARPADHLRRRELVGDLDAMIANFFRSVKHDPGEVAFHADFPVSAWDLTARHQWLIERIDEVKANMLKDPEWCDPKVAAWWAWGKSCWIGLADWCDPKYGKKARKPEVHSGKGVHRPTHLRRPSLYGEGVLRPTHTGKGPDVNNGNGVLRKTHHRNQGLQRDLHQADLPLPVYFAAMAERLRGVKVLGADWNQCVTSAAMRYRESQTVGVFLDPPYAHEVIDPTTGKRIWRRDRCYAHDDATVSAAVRAWAIEHGDDPKMRIVLAGYEGEHEMPEGWRVVAWTPNGGMGRTAQADGKKNSQRERLWLSPHCLPVEGEQPVSVRSAA